MILPAAPDVLSAAHRLRGVIQRTACARSAPLSALAGVDAYLKWENLQTTGSFKLRGAFNALLTLTAEGRRRGVVVSSAGNHGLGIAYAARSLGIRAQVFVPSTAPAVKRDGIIALGAEVDAHHPDYDAAHEAALAHAEREGMTFVSPCAGRPLLAGQGTVGLEILEDLPAVRTLVVPVGGGGLAGGIAVLVRAVAPHVRIVGVQSTLTNAMAVSLSSGLRTTIPIRPTLADGLAGQVDDEGMLIGRFALDEIVEVTEAQIAEAMRWLSHTHEARVEGSGAVGVAALMSRGGWEGPIAVVVSGGNVDSEVWSAIVDDAVAAD
ncbi:MAG: putative threonine dehydratase [Gemmatimonadetes bacterium]|nr:putative threonine dehydratase [Gemmatimonadota bacterium]